MSAHVLHAIELAALAVLWALICRLQLQTGRSGVPGYGVEVERSKQPFDYWAYWSACLLLAGGFAALGVRSLWLWVHGAPKPASPRDWLVFALIAAILLLVLFAKYLFLLWRRGNPLLHWRELRREAELRRMIKALVSDPNERWFGQTVDQFAAFADLDWLEEIVSHLMDQAQPRTLARAIEATDPPDPQDARPSEAESP